MPYNPCSCRGANRGYSRAAAGGAKRLAGEQPKGAPAAALKQTCKAALKAALKTKPIEAASLA